mgnify:CR=1 FL=1
MFSWIKQILFPAKPHQTSAPVPMSAPVSAPKPAPKNEITPEMRRAADAALKQASGDMHATLLPAVIFTMDGTDAPDVLLGSRLGGRPALPQNDTLPMDASGKPMALLIQLNFAEMPHLSGYPEVGLLQVFIQMNDLFGQAFEPDEAPGFALRYDPDPQGFVLAPPVFGPSDTLPPGPPFDMVPFDWADWHTTGKQITFSTNDLPPSMTDYRIAKIIDAHWRALDHTKTDALNDWAFDAHAPGHGNLGGYARYTQEDPRNDPNNAKYDTCLLSLGLADNVIMWGDCGEMSLHISAKDLAARRFDDVLYYWDCC